jgi:drug/metabolite transporter (DMT)-like permease
VRLLPRNNSKEDATNVGLAGNDNLTGALWMLTSAAVATVMSAGVKFLGTDVAATQIAFLRCLIGFFLVLGLMQLGAWRAGRGVNASHQETRNPLALFRTTAPKRLLLLRGLLAAVAINCGYYSITKIPLATVTILFFTTPLFITLLAGPALGESVGWRRWTATLTGFVGAILALDPRPGNFEAVMIVPLISSIAFAGALLLGKKLSAQAASGTILLYTMAVTTLGSLPTALVNWVWPSGTQLALLFLVSIVATLRTYADVRAYAVGEASFVAPFSYLRLVFMSLAGFYLFAEVPEIQAFAGGAIIIGSSLYIAQREARLKRRLSRPTAGPSPD